MSKKAIITTGGHQYVVSEGDVLEVELIKAEKTTSFEPLLVIDGDKVTVGTPVVSGIKVSADVLGEVRGEKVTAIRYKAKKRVKKVHGHKQHLTQIKISKIA
jgi:large subunit ribosomal protein L21